jgi:hypothetical protein
MTREGAEWLACMLVASVGLVLAVCVVPYIPTMDGPQHILSAHIENHYADPGSLYPEFYRILPQFAGKGFALLFAPLESLLPWRVALRITLSFVAVAFAWGYALVVLSLDRTRRATAMLGFVFALPWALYMGFFQFVVGTTLGMYTLAFVLRRPTTTTARHAVLAVLLLAQGVCHVFTALLTGAIVTVLALVAAPKRGRLPELGRMMLVGAPAAALLGLTFVERGRDLRFSEQQRFDWSLAERAGEISRWFVPGPGVRGWLVIGLAVVAAGATLARARHGKATPTEQAFAWLALVFFGLSIFAPLHMPGWQCLAPRFAIVTMVLGLSLVRVPSLAAPWAARALVPLMTLGCLGSALVSASLHRRLAEGCADALAGLDAPLHFEGPRLPIILAPFCGAPRDPAESPVPRASLANNTALLYLVEHGGIGTRMFSGTPAIHAVELVGARRPPRPDSRALEIAQSRFVEKDAKVRASAFTELAAEGMPFEGIHVLGGRPDDFDLFRRRGYVTELEHGTLFIARFEGCPAEVVLDAGSLARGPVHYEYGLFARVLLAPEPRVLGRGVVAPDAPIVDGAIHVALPRRPCGEIWVRVFWDADGSATFTPGDRTCENGRWEGRVRANVTRDHPTVSCASPP